MSQSQLPTCRPAGMQGREGGRAAAREGGGQRPSMGGSASKVSVRGPQLLPTASHRESAGMLLGCALGCGGATAHTALAGRHTQGDKATTACTCSSQALTLSAGLKMGSASSSPYSLSSSQHTTSDLHRGAAQSHLSPQVPGSCWPKLRAAGRGKHAAKSVRHNEDSLCGAGDFGSSTEKGCWVLTVR